MLDMTQRVISFEEPKFCIQEEGRHFEQLLNNELINNESRLGRLGKPL